MEQPGTRQHSCALLILVLQSMAPPTAPQCLSIWEFLVVTNPFSFNCPLHLFLTTDFFSLKSEVGLQGRVPLLPELSWGDDKV